MSSQAWTDRKTNKYRPGINESDAGQLRKMGQLIKNLKPNIVVVVDNAWYHNKLLNHAPTSNRRKQEIMEWRREHS